MISSSKPDWVRAKAPQGPTYARLHTLMKQYSLHTVCEEGHCPNIGECWRAGTVTFMIMGQICTRACRFCNIKSGRPDCVPDPYEPMNIARAARDLRVKYVVLTSVDRDDLADGGASHFAATITELKRSLPDVLVEALIPDFRGDPTHIQMIVQASPDVIGHNLETTEFLTPKLRDPRASYSQSLSVLRQVKQLSGRVLTKSSLMLGLGEQEQDVLRAMRDLRAVGTDFLTLGQYLRPSSRNPPVSEYLTPGRFNYYREEAEQLGFAHVASGPLVRSSYRAGEYFMQRLLKQIHQEVS